TGTRRLVHGADDLERVAAGLAVHGGWASLLDRGQQVGDLRGVAGHLDRGRVRSGPDGPCPAGPGVWAGVVPGIAGRGLRAERAADDPAVLDDHGAARPGDLQPLREAGVRGGAGQDRADGAGAEPDDRQRGVLNLDLVRLGGADRGDLGYRAHAPAQQVHVVDALVHQRAAVHGPGAAPRGAVVVGLR